jgi:hypothetical protein
MNTTNNLNHEITSDTSIIDIDESHNTDDVGYAMPSTSMRVDENRLLDWKTSLQNKKYRR